MDGLSHMQIVAGLTSVASRVMSVVMSQDETINAENDEDAANQVRSGVIEVLKHKAQEPVAIEKLADWPPLLRDTSPHNRLIFIELIRSIYQ